MTAGQAAAKKAMLAAALECIERGRKLREQANAWYCQTAVAEADDSIKIMEDSIAEFFKAEDRELDMRCWRYLRIRYPHLSTNIHDIDRELAFEVRKKVKK